MPFIPKERSDSNASSWSTSSTDSQSTSTANQSEVDRMMMKNIEEFEKNPNVKPKSNSATIDDMLFGGINNATPCLEPQKNEVVSSAGDKLETVKFLKTPSKGKRENLIFSSPQSGSKNIERADSPLNHNPIYKGRKLFSPDRLKANPLFDSNLSSGTERYSLLQRDRITHNVSKEPEMDRKSSNQVSPKQESNREMCRITSKHAHSNRPKSAIFEAEVEGNEIESRGC